MAHMLQFFDVLMVFLSAKDSCQSMAGSYVLEGAILLVATAIFLLWMKRHQTRIMLEKCGLPTVQWKPRFVTYSTIDDTGEVGDIGKQKMEKLPSSNITNILPRMERLNGPFGMYGTVYGIATPVVHVAHPVPARAIFSATAPPCQKLSSSSYGKRRRSSTTQSSNGASKAPAYDHFKNFCGEGVFTADGDDWKAKRMSIMHCLVKGLSTPEGLQRLECEANRAADAFVVQVEEIRSTKQTKAACATTNVVKLLQRSTIGLIYRYITHHEPDWGLGGNLDSLEVTSVSSDENASVSSCDTEENLSAETLTKIPKQSLAPKFDGAPNAPLRASKYHTTSLLETYLDSVTRIRMIILAQSRSIWFLLPRWCYKFFSSMYQDEECTVAPIREFAKQACKNAAPGSPLDMLKHSESHNKHTMLSSWSLSWFRKSLETVPRYSKDLFDEAITLLFAGQDTSAATLSWTLHLLSLYPRVQDKLANEIRTVLKGEGLLDKSNPVVTKKIISKMPYLDAVVKESMRYYPVAPFVVRKLLHQVPIIDVDDENNKTETVLQAGTFACIWIFGMHRNPILWNRPDDFLPERWIDPALKDIGQTAGAYLPFASGPRNCVGQPLAHIILRTLLTRLVHRYKFCDERLRDGIDASTLRKDMQAGFTVLPLGGLTLSIEKRS